MPGCVTGGSICPELAASGSPCVASVFTSPTLLSVALFVLGAMNWTHDTRIDAAPASEVMPLATARAAIVCVAASPATSKL